MPYYAKKVNNEYVAKKCSSKIPDGEGWAQIDSLQSVNIVKKISNEEKLIDIDNRLFDNDIKRIRAIAENDFDYIELYNNIAISLRHERKKLTNGGE